uniref:Uncharacterized protein n=1 Tax=Trichogramma kaykai TaxID=54128 RepID=A0ABD2X4X4_9HYME
MHIFQEKAEKILRREKRTSSACLFYRKISMSPVLPRCLKKFETMAAINKHYSGLDCDSVVKYHEDYEYSIYIAIRTRCASRESELVVRARPAILRSEKSSYTRKDATEYIYEYIIIYGPPRRSRARALAPRYYRADS